MPAGRAVEHTTAVAGRRTRSEVPDVPHPFGPVLMQAGALAPYESALRYSSRPLRLRTRAGDLVELDVARWLSDADAADLTVIGRCRGPVLDVGCGPGRFVGALQAGGIPALGVDIAETAIEFTRGLGGAALLRSVFADLPGEGRWPTVLLMDGNVGIGGDPVRLLRRVRALLAPGGVLIVESDVDPDSCQVLDVRFVHGDEPVGPEFAWARVGVGPLRGHADRTGFVLDEVWNADDRTFVALRATGTAASD